MPEGDTIFRAAARLRAVLEGRTIAAAAAPGGAVQVAELPGQRVVSVESRGKHLLIHWERGLVLHSHLGMTGSWRIVQLQQPWSKPQHRAAIILQSETHRVACFYPKTLELLTATQFRRHALLHSLGPDLLGEACDLSVALRRLRRQPETPLGVALMDQRNVGGIGNVYKSEVLFLCHVDPFAPVARADDALLHAILQTVQRLLRNNLEGYRRTTRNALDGGRLWVYRRAGQPCLHCGDAIRMRRQGDLGRSTYWCPTCQSLPRR